MIFGKKRKLEKIYLEDCGRKRKRGGERGRGREGERDKKRMGRMRYEGWG